MEKIDVYEYVVFLKKFLEWFEKYWEGKHAENKELFPEKMSGGEWDEQFNFFLSDHAGKDVKK